MKKNKVKAVTAMDIISKTRNRERLPKPATFSDRRKYDRNRRKNLDRKEIIAWR